MNPMEEVMRAMASCGDKKPIVGEEREKFFAILQPITDLKPGDRVKWKEGMRDKKFPRYGQTAEVFRLMSKSRLAQGDNHDCDEDDFSILFRDDDGNVSEFIFDSRRFERVL